MKPTTPLAVIRGRAAALAGTDPQALPAKWEKIGDVLVLRLPQGVPWHGEIASVYARVLGARTVVEDIARIRGPWRVPEVRWLWGDGTETVHVENGVRFKLDVAKLMFSSGNLDERLRMARIVRPGETVVDLFAGIGYFALPIAVHARPEKVVACEVNPTAYRYLQENIRQNRAGTVEARQGDCRVVAPKGIADRVIMGHFDAPKYLDVAFDAVKGGATIHVHELLRLPKPKSALPREGVPGPLGEALREAAARNGYRITQVVPRFVKWYGPRRAHVVVDASVVPG